MIVRFVVPGSGQFEADVPSGTTVREAAEQAVSPDGEKMRGISGAVLKIGRDDLVEPGHQLTGRESFLLTVSTKVEGGR